MGNDISLANREHLLIVAIVAALAGCADSVCADSLFPHSWTLTSANERYLLVLVFPLPIEKDVILAPGSEKSNVRAIREKYSLSGLYTNDGSTTPLWTTAGFFDNSHDVYIADDGVHMVVADDWANNQSDHVVSFFQSGRYTEEYMLTELMPYPWLQRLFNGGGQVSRRSAHFDEAAMTSTVTTNQGEEFVFDVKTGAILRQTSLTGLFLAIFLSSVLLVVLGAIGGGTWWWYRRARQRAAG